MKGLDIVEMTGPFYFFVPFAATFVVFLTEIVREKEKKLR